MLRREDGHVFTRVYVFGVEDQSTKGRQKTTLKKQVGQESMKIGLRREDALCRSKWSACVNQIADGLR